MDSYLQRVIEEFEEFKDISLKGSQRASKREALTSHKLEYLQQFPFKPTTTKLSQ
jgi:hypothetical protein